MTTIFIILKLVLLFIYSTLMPRKDEATTSPSKFQEQCRSLATTKMVQSEWPIELISLLVTVLAFIYNK